MNKTQNNEKNVFPSGLKDFMSRCKIDEKSISKRCGVSLSLVYNWLNGKNIPTYKSLQKLFEMGMHPEEMFCFAGEIESAERSAQIENFNQQNIDDLKSSLYSSYKRIILFEIKNGSQNAFNDLQIKDKLNLLYRTIDEEISTIDEVNEILKDLTSKI